MHEMSIAMNLVAQLCDIADRNNVRQFERVELELGVLQLVEPEALRLAFAAASTDTPAAGAGLELTEVPARARCHGCGAEFAVAVDDYLCPQCGQANVELLAGNDIVLRSVTGQTDEAEA
jgi:hydrogenase nickel incorporation protein HypA/HybF